MRSGVWYGAAAVLLAVALIGPAPGQPSGESTPRAAPSPKPSTSQPSKRKAAASPKKSAGQSKSAGKKDAAKKGKAAASTAPKKGPEDDGVAAGKFPKGAEKSKAGPPAAADPPAPTKAQTPASPAAGTSSAPAVAPPPPGGAQAAPPPANGTPAQPSGAAPPGQKSAEPAARPPAPSIEEQFATCLACHGKDGHSETAEIPSIGGQPSLFVMYQLVMLREGQRKIAAMDYFAKQFTDENVQRYADIITKLPAPPAPAEPVNTARFARGKAIAARTHCAVCHNEDYSGKDQNPRLAHQREDYLLKSLQDYQSGRRVGYRATMAEAVQGLSDADLKDLAHYLAQFR